MKIGSLNINKEELNYYRIVWDDICELNDVIHFHFKNGSHVWTHISRKEALNIEEKLGI